MKILVSLFLLFTLISCQQDKAARLPASLSDFKDHNGVMYISSYGQETGDHQFKDIDDIVSRVNNRMTTAQAASLKTFSLAHYQVETLPQDQAIAIDIDVSDDGRHVIKIFSNKSKESTPEILEELDHTLNQLFDSNVFVTPLAFFETSFNARNNDTKSIKVLTELKKRSLEIAELETEENPFFEEESQKVQLALEQLDKKLKVERKEQIKQEKLRKSSLTVLDKADKDGQLRTLIQKNDRAGVVELIERYLPREYMTPIEHRYWNLVLEKIANPAPLKDRVVMYRGTSGDKLYPMIKDGVELTKEEAVKQGKLVAMSTMMTRNQGTWNRRLRSLQAVYNKDFSLNLSDKDSKVPQTHRLATWMKSHSRSPEGSPFLSFSSEIGVSINFGDESLGAFLVDPDMLLFNQMSDFSGEMEYLHILMTFPDEMIAYYDHEFDTKLSRREIKDTIQKRMRENLEKEYAQSTDEVLAKIEQRSIAFRDKQSAYLIPQVETVKVKKTKVVKPGFFGKIWAKIMKKDPVYQTYYDYEKRPKKVESYNNCIYLIKAFI